MKKTSKKAEEKVLNEEEKVMEENQEEVLTKDLKELKKELAGFEEYKLPTEKVCTNITKLKCDYTTYKEERTKYNMPVEEKCQKCGKKFKDGDELYIAYIIDGDVKTSCIICKKCAKI